MTKKDFQLIAGTIHDAAHFVHGLTSIQREAVTAHYAHAFADALATTNPLFKRELFIQAATGSVNKSKYEPSPKYGVNADGTRVFGTCNYCGHAGTDCRCAQTRTLASDLAEDR